MKQKSGGIKRLMEFTGKHRGLLTVSRILSGISSAFILGPFLCVYFAARDLVGVFAGTPLDISQKCLWDTLTPIPAENFGRLLTTTVFRLRLSSLTSSPTWWARRSR